MKNILVHVLSAICSMMIGKHKKALIMRTILFTSILSLLFLTTAMAQEPAICGDWIGVYKGYKMSDKVNEDGEHYPPVQTDYKAYLRIKIIDNHYSVRMKTRIADESKPFEYEPDCQIVDANEKSITWIFDNGDDYDWSSTAKEQGIKIGHTHDITRCSVTLTNGILHYSELFITTYYDMQGREITTKQWNRENKTFSLYKEDKDW